jgi:ubiquinone biosynthesis protein UbiJ
MEDYEHMSIGRLEHLATQGDPRAQQAIQSFAQEFEQTLKDTLAPSTGDVGGWVTAQYRELDALQASVDGVARLKEAQERAAVEREQTMIRELAGVRRAVQRADEREAAAIERAERAEAREAERIGTAERREWAMAAMTFVATLAAVVAIALH